MADLTISAFGGELPLIAPRLLPQGKAVTAKNVRLDSGNYRPFRDFGAVTHEATDPVAFLYRLHDNSHAFLTWDDPAVCVVDGPIANDEWQRVYFTGDGPPKYVDQSNYLGTPRLLGVPAPSQPVGCVRLAGSETDLDVSDDETRFYLYTWVTDRGEESAPSPVSLAVELQLSDDQVQVTLPALGSNQHHITKARIYRSATTADTADFYQVAEVAIATGVATTIVDDKSTAELSMPLPSAAWDMPRADLQGLTAVAGGFLVGFAGKSVYASEAYLPFAWPVSYSHTCEFAVVALAEVGGGVAVLTEGKPYLLAGSAPENLYLQPLDIHQACVSARSVVSTAGMVIYASPDGLVSLASNGSQLLTEGLLSREQWQAYKPESMVCTVYEGLYLAAFDTGAEQGILVFDFRKGEFTRLDGLVSGWVRDELSDTVYGCTADGWRTFDKGAWLQGEWLSAPVRLAESNFNYLQVRSHAPYPLVTLFADGAELMSFAPNQQLHTVRMPLKRASEWQVKIAGSAEVEGVALAQDPKELSL